MNFGHKLKNVVVVDSGSGNVRSVLAAFRRAGAEAFLSRDADDIRRADCVVMPGQSAFADVMQNLQSKGIDQVVIESIKSGVPYVGICLGMQILFAESDESPGVKGLGVLQGRVEHIKNIVRGDETLKIPHMGWNQLTFSRPMFSEERAWVYFAHSFYCKPQDKRDVVATTRYGDVFCSAVLKDNIFGCQFHPEKSHKSGAQIIDSLVRGKVWS